MLWKCLLDGDVRGELMQQFASLPAGLWEAIEVSQWNSDVSLPDPAMNGMLWGALAAADWGPRIQVQCNFIGRNRLQTELRLYPHRVMKTVMLFLLRLPYRAIFKQWRAS